jgi:6-phosphogluconate dehydrogenase
MTSEVTKPSVALLGLGKMGEPMAADILRAGYRLTVWNRTRTKADASIGAHYIAGPVVGRGDAAKAARRGGLADPKPGEARHD